MNFSNIQGILHMGSKEIYARSLVLGFGNPNMKTKVDKEAPLKTKRQTQRLEWCVGL